MSEADTWLMTLKVEVDGRNEGRRTAEAASELHRDLRKYLPSALPDAQPADGDKGLAEDLLTITLTLVSSGAMTEAVKLMRDWVKRLPSRRSVVIYGGDGKEIYRVSGENVSDATMVEALTAAAKTAKR